LFFLASHFFRSHLREQEYILDRNMSGKKHTESIDTNTDTSSWRHTIFQCAQEIVIDKHGFIVATLHQLYLIFKALALVDWVIQLGVSVCYFFTIDHEFKSFHQSGLITMLFGKRTHFYRVVGNKCWLDIMMLTFFAEDEINQLAFTHRRF